jgi:LacI family transcriptional regulator
VLINREPDDTPFRSVRADDESAAFACVRWLIDQGRTRIAVIAGLPNISTSRDRLAGYRRALASAGLVEDPEFVAPGHASTEGGHDAARVLMLRASPPDAIFVHNNVMLSGATLALQDLGIRWPGQIDIAGSGAFSEARLYAPPLTVVAQPAYEMGRVAIELLVDRIRRRASEAPAKVVLRNQLVTREDWVRQQSERRVGVKKSLASLGDSADDPATTPAHRST